MKKCMYCAEEIQDEAILCRYCNRDQRIPVPPPMVAQLQAAAPAAAAPAQAQAQKGGPTILRVIVWSVVFCFAMIIWIGLSGGTNNEVLGAGIIGWIVGGLIGALDYHGSKIRYEKNLKSNR